MKIVTIHPEEKPDLTLPYPWMIDADGMVLRQNFWKGKPYRLIGFEKEGDVAYIWCAQNFGNALKKQLGCSPSLRIRDVDGSRILGVRLTGFL